jgi:hypothetical protein
MQSECKGPDSWLYEYTHHGLDPMMQQYLEYGLTIDNYQYMDPDLGGPMYDYLWNTYPDLSGGFQDLFDAYSEFVNANLKDVLTLHILLFVLTVVLMSGYVFFMVLPFVKSTTYETRRIAELISQLPAEVRHSMGSPCPPLACLPAVHSIRTCLSKHVFLTTRWHVATSPPLPLQFDLESMFAKTKLAEFINAAGPGTVPRAAGAAGGGGGAPLLQGPAPQQN